MEISNIDQLYDEFYADYHKKDFQRGINILKSIQQIEGKASFWIYSRLSSCYYELKEYDQATYYGQLGYKLNPKSPLVIWDYAGALMMAKKEKKAIKLLLSLQDMDDDLTKYGFANPGRKWMQSLKRDANFLIGKAYYTICEDHLAKTYLEKYLNQRRRGLKTIYSRKQVETYLEKLEGIK